MNGRNHDLALARIVAAIREWERSWGAYESHQSTLTDEDRFHEVLEEYVDRLGGNYPFFHPRYVGQMLKPPNPVAVAGYLGAMLINPNNHALDGGPPTSAMEKEVIRQLIRHFDFPDESLGHLTSSGTIANLEALWVARERHPEKGIVVSDQAHYTHERMARLLRMDVQVVPSDREGRIDLDAVEDAVRSGGIGTIVLTAGTTGLGAVDPIAEILPWRDQYGVGIHIDAAYGGFFKLLASAGDTRSPLGQETRRHLRAVAHCDSLVVDPHKHGLQPYGCGCVLFRDAAVGRHYVHDSAYTYFTSDDLHLGEISLECSRAGAAAGALWLTLKLFPLHSDEGLGPILAAGSRAARRWYELFEQSETMTAHVAPELDIITYYPIADNVGVASRAVFEATMAHPDRPVFLSLLRVRTGDLTHGSAGREDGGLTSILRSVLMKPEHEQMVDWLHEQVSSAVDEVLRA